MKYFVYQLKKDGYFNRFITTGTYTKRQEFKKVVLSGKVNEWLKKDFSIYENPCRKEFLEKRKQEQPQYLDISKYTMQDEVIVFGEERKLSLYYPFGNQGVDFSEFYFNPTYLRSYSYALVLAEQEEVAELVLETCGGMTLWVNDNFVTDFIPFTRNKKNETRVLVELKKGFNKIVICLDDLAERDTDYYFRIKYLGNERLKICLPVGDDVDVEAMEQVERALADCYFEKETYISEPVILNLRNPLSQELEVSVTYKPVADKMSHPERLAVSNTYKLEKGAGQIKLFSADQVIPGFYYFRIRSGVNHIWAECSIATQVFHQSLLDKKTETIEERKQEALHYLVENEVENVYKAAAMIAEGRNLKRAEAIIVEEMEGIRARKDCSDFHLIVILQIWKLFEDRISIELKEAVKQLVLEFRYWIDEPGNDVMWFFSENHALLFHICQYYAGNLFPEEVFVNSGFTGRELGQKAEGLLEIWFDSFMKEYITEWNSNAYIPVDVLGLCGLYNLTEETEHWHIMAQKGLDRIFRDMTLCAHKGAVMTTFGRSYEKESKGNYTAGTTSLLYIAYGTGCLNRAALAYISLALGKYMPPAEYKNWLSVDDGQDMIYEKTQGYEGHVNLYHYKNSYVQLSTAIAFHSFTPGYQEHIMQATLDSVAQMYVNHPGEKQPYGNGRPNYWAGNGSLPLAVQHRNLGIMIYHIPKEHPVNFTHAYVPLMEFFDYKGTADTVAAKKDGGYIGLRALNGLKIQKSGPCRDREFISEGLDNVWIIKVGTQEEYPTLEAFHDSLASLKLDWQMGECLTVQDENYNTFVVMEKEKRLLQNGKPVYDYPLSSEGRVRWEKSTMTENERGVEGNE